MKLSDKLEHKASLTGDYFSSDIEEKAELKTMAIQAQSLETENERMKEKQTIFKKFADEYQELTKPQWDELKNQLKEVKQ